MEACDPPPKRALAPHAPVIVRVSVPPEKVGVLIGPGGRTIRAIMSESGCASVQVINADAGIVELCDASADAVAAAAAAVKGLTTDPAPGELYRGARVASVEKFGLILDFMPGRSGLCHVSELGPGPGPDGYAIGDRVDVLLLEVRMDRDEDGWVLVLVCLPRNETEQTHVPLSLSLSTHFTRQASDNRFKLSRKAALAVDAGEPIPDAPPPPPPPPPLEVGQLIRGGTVRGVAAFGVFVDVGGGRSGLVHVSELADAIPEAGRRGAGGAAAAAAALARYDKGDAIDVVVLALTDDGRINLSEKAAVVQRSGSGDGSEWTVGGGWDGEEESGGEGPGTPQRAEAARRR